MRTLTSVLVLLLVAVVVGPALLAADGSSSQDSVWAHFSHAVMFQERLLPSGNYLIVHDDEKKAAGEPCLYVFGESDLDEPLVAVHCLRVVRDSVDETRIVLARTLQSADVRQFGYVQFAGDAYGHYLR